ncbi:glutamate--tRNA ligase [Spirochaetia bacterium]|nr:glutamate--tRNA ligase [Spirochaetia bacterium]GHU30880.1 glutamate--tRNA ligase [Spirochaetia bacterium]
MNIRDRYAPSPTGLQHIGGIRTALFNYLLAQSKQGDFILRLEDTDRNRFDPSFVQNLYDTFRWLGIQWDEGPDIGGPFAPYVQSERFALYQDYALNLLNRGRAYRCFCSTKRLEAIRKERESAHAAAIGYDRHCRYLSPQESEDRADSGEAFTIRLKIPLGESTCFEDQLLGRIEWRNEDLNPDPVLLKSDGFPTYHLANVVDDHVMGISHVLRAQEWLPSTPLHIILYHFFGWKEPEFCHLPMVMGPDGKKLSKRHGATSVDEFRRQGYLPEALINYVALLGASYEEGRDIYLLAELAARFSIDKLNKAPAIFDYKKLEWFNGQYIRAKTNEELALCAMPYAQSAGLFGNPDTQPDADQEKTFIAAMPLIKERVTLLSEIPAKIAYLFREPDLPDVEDFIPRKSDLATAITLLMSGKELVEDLSRFNDADGERLAKEKAEKEQIKLGDLLMPLRVAITGSRVSPPLFGSIRILGAQKSMDRIEHAIASLHSRVHKDL